MHCNDNYLGIFYVLENLKKNFNSLPVYPEINNLRKLNKNYFINCQKIYYEQSQRNKISFKYSKTIQSKR